MAKQINVTDAVYDEIQRRKSTVGTIAQQKRPDTPGGCSMENQFDGNGDMTGTACMQDTGSANRPGHEPAGQATTTPGRTPTTFFSGKSWSGPVNG